MTLFWRLFLSLLLMILITSILSISVERWLNEQELATRMDSQIEKLLVKRKQLVEALQEGDMIAVKQLYAQDRRLMTQIRIYDEQGSIIYPRYRYREGRAEERQVTGSTISTLPGSRDRDSVNKRFDVEGSSNKPTNKSGSNDFNNKGFNNSESDYSKFSNKERSNRNPYSSYGLSGYNLVEEDSGNKPFVLDDILQPKPAHKALADTDSRPELTDIIVKLPDEQTVILQLRPHLLFKDVLELQRGNFTVRLGLIVFFSILVCFWLSRTLTQRIRKVQHTVHRMLVGDYQVNPSLATLGTDELGLLATDVAQLSTRLADSELARKQMLSDISHELRSPLARLDVATELTRDFAPHADRYLDRIDKESARMNELIEQIIRIQSLQMQQYTTNKFKNEPVNIPELISKIGQDVCFEFQNKEVRWQWRSPPSFYTVLGNQDQLHSALENVVRNAFMHTKPGSSVTTEVVKIKTSKTTEVIQVNIMDEGGGVAEEDLERILQPFVRLDSARNRQTGGYGLGLAIVHAVITVHKGQVNVHNRQDGIQGLVVQITLPVE